MVARAFGNFCILLLIIGIVAGCSGETNDFRSEGLARTRVQGVLAQSPTGSIALLDTPLPAGFRPLSETAVRVLESGLTAFSGEDGSLDLPSSEGRSRLEVTTASGAYVLEVPGFSSEGGQPVGLQHFPPKMSLAQGEVRAARAVGVDREGRYVPVSATQRAIPLPDSVDIPHTTTLAARPQAGSTDGAGYQVVQSAVGSLRQSADTSSYSEACQAMLAGQVVSNGRPVAGAVVQVEGSAKSYSTGSDGLYTFEHLAPVPSTVHVYLDGEQIGLGFAPLTSRLLTRLDIPARPTSYQAGVTLEVKNAAGVAVRSNRDIYVCDGSTLSEFTPQGGAVQPTGGPLQSAVGVAADFSGEAYVADKTANSVVTLGGSLSVSSPIGLAVDRGANVFALSEGATGLSYFVNQSNTEWSEPVILAEDLLQQPVAVAAGPDGEVFVVDAEAAQVSVLEITQNGRTLHGDPSSTRSLEARLVAHWPVADPLGIAVGPNGEVYVAGASGVVVTDDRGHDPITVSQNAALGPIGVDPFGLVWVAEAGGVQSYAPTTPAVIQNPVPTPTGQTLVSGSALHSMESSLLHSMDEYGFVGGHAGYFGQRSPGPEPGLRIRGVHH